MTAKLLVSRERFWREVADAKRRIISRALAECGGRTTRAARALGINRNTLHKNMRDLGMDVKTRRRPERSEAIR